MNWLEDLWNRIVENRKSSATALVLTLLTFLSDHGISLSEQNKGWLVAKAVAFVGALAHFLFKDTTGGNTNA